MTVFDIIVLLIIGISIVVSVMRGAIKEFLAIAGWVAALYVARTYASELSPLLSEGIPSEPLKVLAAFIILLLAVLLIANLLSFVISGVFKKIGLGGFNRLLGAFFGFARGLLIVCVLVFLAGLTSIPKDIRWTNAMFSAPLETLVKSVLPWLPSTVTKYVSFD